MRLPRSVSKLVPTIIKRWYAGYVTSKRVRARRRHRANADLLSKAQFRSLLTDANIQAGNLLLVHSALGEFNPVEGGPSGVLECLLDVIGTSGTLIVPTFPHWLTTIEQNLPFDVRHSHSSTGVLTELVRALPEAKRSLHPTHPVCAVGPLAEELIEGHQNSRYAFGEGTPFYRHAQWGGKILMVGVDLNSQTSFHIYEDMVLPIDWLAVYEEEPREFTLIDSTGNPATYSGFFHQHETAIIRDVERLREAYQHHAELKRIETDYSFIDTMQAKGVVLACLDELSNGYTGYGQVTLTAENRVQIEHAMTEAQSWPASHS